MYYCTTDMNLISFSIVLEVRLLIRQWPDFTGVTKEGILQTCMNSFHFYRPQTKFAKVMFLQVSVCPQGRCAWLLGGGACVVAPGGGVHGCSGGAACVVAPGGCAWLLWGGAWLLPGGHVWLL